jgi:PAS domain S-box-containing protein
MSAITIRARQVADGEPSGDWPRGPIAEINVLAASLESMANHLQEHNDQFRAIFDASPVPMAVVDGREDGVLVDINDAWVRQFRRSREETIGRSTRELQLWADGSDILDILRAMPVDASRFETWLRDAAQRSLLCEISTRPVIIGGKTYAIWVIEDITERKQAEEKLRAALAEKEVLLKEIYHRVKNNLQVVSSLLNLQSRRATETETKRLLGDSANRVNSIALVHAQLYRAENLASIGLQEYVRQLADNLISVNHPRSARVELRVEVDDLFVGIENAIPLGLMINELVSNAYRHGYADDTVDGKISVRILGLVGGQIRVEVEDNGRGLPADFELGTGGGLGMHLVVALAQQLGSELTLHACHSGTRFTLVFKPELLTT